MRKLEDGLYNYVSANPKFLKRFFLTILIGVLGTILNYYSNVFNDQNLSYYLFSTIVQGFIALVGFLGAVVIFKLQLTENDASVTTDGVRHFMKDNVGLIAETYSSIEMMNEIGGILESKNIMHKEQLTLVHIKLKKILDEKGEIRSRMVDFSLWCFIDVSIALIGLPLSKLLFFKGLYFILAMYSIVNILISVAALFAAFFLITKILGYSFKINI